MSSVAPLVICQIYVVVGPKGSVTQRAAEKILTQIKRLKPALRSCRIKVVVRNLQEPDIEECRKQGITQLPILIILNPDGTRTKEEPVATTPLIIKYLEYLIRNVAEDKMRHQQDELATDYGGSAEAYIRMEGDVENFRLNGEAEDWGADDMEDKMDFSSQMRQYNDNRADQLTSLWRQHNPRAKKAPNFRIQNPEEQQHEQPRGPSAGGVGMHRTAPPARRSQFQAQDYYEDDEAEQDSGAGYSRGTRRVGHMDEKASRARADNISSDHRANEETSSTMDELFNLVNRNLHGDASGGGFLPQSGDQSDDHMLSRKLENM